MRLEQSIGNTDRSHSHISFTFKYIHDNCQCTGIPPVCFNLTCLKCWKTFCTSGSALLLIGFLNRIEWDTMPHTCAVERVRWQPQQFDPTLSLTFPYSSSPNHTHTNICWCAQCTHTHAHTVLSFIFIVHVPHWYCWHDETINIGMCKYVCVYFVNFRRFSRSPFPSIFRSNERNHDERTMPSIWTGRV